LCAFGGGFGSVDGVTTDGVGGRAGGLSVGREFEHHPSVIKRQLLVVASFLRVVEAFLADVSGYLLAIDSRLAIVESTESRVVSVCGVIAVFVVGGLFVIDA
jgi:hypothetical protein